MSDLHPLLYGIEFYLLGGHWFSFEPRNHHFKTRIKRDLYILVTHNKRKVALTLYRINRQCLLNKNQGHLGNAIFTLYSFPLHLSLSNSHTSNNNCRSCSVYSTVALLKNPFWIWRQISNRTLIKAQ